MHNPSYHLLHQFNGRPSRLWRHLHHGHRDGTHIHIHVNILVNRQAHVLHHHSRQIRAVAVVFWVKDDRAASAALLRSRQRPAAGPLVGGDRHRSSGVDPAGLGLRIGLQLG